MDVKRSNSYDQYGSSPENITPDFDTTIGFVGGPMTDTDSAAFYLNLSLCDIKETNQPSGLSGDFELKCQTRGLISAKEEMQYGLEVFQSGMMPIMSHPYSPSPAAFGAYPSTTPENYFESSTDYQNGIHSIIDSFTEEYNYKHYYQNVPPFHHDGMIDPNMVNGNWIVQRDMYLEPFSEYVNDEVDGMGYEYMQINPMNVYPAILEGSYIGATVESGQTITPSSESTPLTTSSHSKKGTRSIGLPTIVVSSTSKMDRKTLKRLKNRVSASRCRIKKKELITELEYEASVLHNENMCLRQKITNVEDSILKARNYLQYRRDPNFYLYFT